MPRRRRHTEDQETPSLGPCCGCERTDGVRNIFMLHQKAPIPGHGWGCVVCGLPSDGAVAVLCDACLELSQRQAQEGDGGRSVFRLACRGYPATEGRVPIDDLEGHHDHDLRYHEYEGF